MIVIKDELIKQIAIKKDLPESMVSTIISHEFDSAYQATANNNSIEISGFGKFVFNIKRAAKRLEKYYEITTYLQTTIDDPLTTDVVRHKSQLKLNTLAINIEHLKSKLKTNE